MYNRQPGYWADYDRQFHLKASATSSTEWSTIDLNIWNDAFPDITTNHGPSPVQSQPRSQYSTQRYTSTQTIDSPLHHSNTYTWIGMMTQALLVHILSVNMTTSAIDALTIQELPITVTRQCFVLIKAKGLNVNPLLARKGGSCELRLTIIDYIY